MEGGELSHRRHGHSRSKAFVNGVFAFFLSVSLLGIMVLTAVRVGMMSKVGFISVLDDEYYTLTLDYIEEKANYYTLPTGIDPSVLDGVFNVDEIRTDVDGFAAGAIDGTGYVAKTDDLHSRVITRVDAAFATDGVTTGDGGDADEIAHAYADDIVEIYLDAVQMPGLDVVTQVHDVYVRFYLIAVVFLIALSVVLSIAIVHMHHFKHRGMRYLAYATGGATLMGFVLPFIIYVSGFYKGLNVQPQFFYHFCVSLVGHVLRLCMISSAILLLITIALVVLIGRMRQAQIKKSRSHRHF